MHAVLASFVAFTHHQLTKAAAIISVTVTVARAKLPIAPTMKTLGVVFDCSLTFDSHAKAVARGCNYLHLPHSLQAIRHIRLLMSSE